MNRRRWLWAGFFLLLMLLAANSVWAMSSANYRLDWIMPMDGTGGSSASANFQAQVTVGQLSGVETSANYQACTGFWSPFIGGRGLLPMVRR